MRRDEENQSSCNNKIGKMKKSFDVLWKNMKKVPGLTWGTLSEVGREDPRRIIHAVKVGISLTLVSLLFLLEPLFEGVGEYAMWAVMTVVAVLEFTAGGALYKGLNRGVGTLISGSLALLIEYTASQSGNISRAVFISSACFVIGAVATYVRFVPFIKKNYDYGVLTFILTFNLITLSSYHVNDVFLMARYRIVNIAIGVFICLIMSLIIFPKWSGEDLHNSTVSKLEGLAKSIEACVNEYFSVVDVDKMDEETSEDSIYDGYKAVLDSKQSDETMALYASWEPRYSRYCRRLPYKQYVKLGGALRHFGYAVVALHGCLQTEIQTPQSVRLLFKDPCTRLAGEVSKALLELSDSIKRRRQCSLEVLSDLLHQALQDLDVVFKSQPKLFLGPNAYQHTMLALHATSTTSNNNSGKHIGSALSSLKPDPSALLDRRSTRRGSNQSPRTERNRTLRPSFSRTAITTLEFSEALPFAAFASLLVEAVARLDLVIEEVEELGRLAKFKESTPTNEVVVNCDRPNNEENDNNFSSHAKQ